MKISENYKGLNIYQYDHSKFFTKSIRFDGEYNINHESIEDARKFIDQLKIECESQDKEEKEYDHKTNLLDMKEYYGSWENVREVIKQIENNNV